MKKDTRKAPLRYYIAIDKNDVIWGIGTSEKEAREDARRCLDNRRPRLKTLRCTKAMYADIYKNGYCHDGLEAPYWNYAASIEMAYYPVVQKRKNVFKTL